MEGVLLLPSRPRVTTYLLIARKWRGGGHKPPVSVLVMLVLISNQPDKSNTNFISISIWSVSWSNMLCRRRVFLSDEARGRFERKPAQTHLPGHITATMSLDHNLLGFLTIACRRPTSDISEVTPASDPRRTLPTRGRACRPVPSQPPWTGLTHSWPWKRKMSYST